MEKNLTKFVILLTSIFLGYTCLVYELALAQTLSLLMGQTNIRYPITIGLYTASLGLGSLCFDSFTRKFTGTVRKLIWLEWFLSVLGIFSFLLVFGVEIVARKYWPNYYLETSYLREILAYLLVLGIGVLCGAELPLLMKLWEEHGLGSSQKLLTFDYLGTLLAAVLFPLLLLPHLSLFAIVISTVLVNISCCIYLILCFDKSPEQFGWRALRLSFSSWGYLMLLPLLGVWILVFFQDAIQKSF